MTTATGLLDGPALAEALHVHPGTIRNWAHAGLLQRRDTDENGRAVYDLEDAVELAKTRRIRPSWRNPHSQDYSPSNGRGMSGAERGGAGRSARRTHNSQVAGSNPAPATRRQR
jgi:hypothetical protein